MQRSSPEGSLVHAQLSQQERTRAQITDRKYSVSHPGSLSRIELTNAKPTVRPTDETNSLYGVLLREVISYDQINRGCRGTHRLN